MHRLAVAASLTGFFTLFAGCGEDDASATVRRTIGRDGGQISSHDGVLTLLFLPGSLDGDEDVSVAPSDAPPSVFGPAYRVEPDIDLNLPAEVTYRRELPGDPETAVVGVVRRAAFESGSANWVSIGRIALSEDLDLVVATDTELSMFYALLDTGSSGTTTTDMPTGSGSTTGDTDPTDTDETTTVSPPDMGEDTDPTTGGGPLSHATHMQPIWEANCLGGDACHVPGGATPNLQDDAYANLVGIGSTVATATLITGGDAAASYLMHKLDATHNLDTNLGGCGCAGAGNSMPSGAPLLPMDTRTRIRDWINEGAEP